MRLVGPLHCRPDRPPPVETSVLDELLPGVLRTPSLVGLRRRVGSPVVLPSVGSECYSVMVSVLRPVRFTKGGPVLRNRRLDECRWLAVFRVEDPLPFHGSATLRSSTSRCPLRPVHTPTLFDDSGCGVHETPERRVDVPLPCDTRRQEEGPVNQVDEEKTTVGEKVDESPTFPLTSRFGDAHSCLLPVSVSVSHLETWNPPL